MAQVHPEITAELRSFIEAQPMFFVASAPLSATGRVNLSVKGLDTFCILSPFRVAYLDLTGSGNETAAHLLENGRITFMFCAVNGSPKILRLYGSGRLVRPGDAAWQELSGSFASYVGARQIVVAQISRVQTSCGFGVPLMKLEGQRELLPQWAQKRSAEELAANRAKKNSRSIDGLPTGIDPPG